MTTASGPQFELNAEEIAALFADRAVNGVLLDRSGAIVYVSQGWKAFAQSAGLALPDFGIGQNYIRHCAYADQESARIVDGIAQLLANRIDFLAFVYPCHSPNERRWFLLLGFPHVKGSLTALVHIDITGFMPLETEQHQPAVLAERFGVRSPSEARRDEPIAPGEETPILSSVAKGFVPRARAKSGTSTPALSKRQREVLELIAKGMSNGQIARALAISPNTVKIHVSGILTRLGLPSRTQAIHWMLTGGLQESSRQSDS